MELPHLGKHCCEDGCNRLDFLPVKCDGCSKVFCGDHYKYTGHNCPAAYKKNVQVPICPLCNVPVPGNLNELPDIRVSQHIDNDCRSDTALSRRKKVYSNRCTAEGCKKKEMIPILCDKCNLNYCLKHRHPQDHKCSKISVKPVGKAGQAALSRHSQGTSSKTANGNKGLTSRLSSFQGHMSEDEAMRLAMQASLNMTSGQLEGPSLGLSQEQEDFILAQTIAESERQAATAGGGANENRGRRSQPNCEIS